MKKLNLKTLALLGLSGGLLLGAGSTQNTANTSAQANAKAPAQSHTAQTTDATVNPASGEAAAKELSCKANNHCKGTGSCNNGDQGCDGKNSSKGKGDGSLDKKSAK